jgi:hypothetical protein
MNYYTTDSGAMDIFMNTNILGWDTTSESCKLSTRVAVEVQYQKTTDDAWRTVSYE